MPVAAVGLAFDPAHPPAPDDPWSGWPGAWVLVPERLVWRRGDRAGVVLRGRGDVDAALADLDPRPGDAAGAPVAGRPLESRDAWRERVARALGDLGDVLQKVVLARAVEHVAGGAFDPAATLARLDDPRAAVRFATAPGGAARGCFVGATPEALVRVAGRDVRTVALAGTTRRGADATDDEALGAALLASDKDRREHALVVDAVRAALGPLCDALDAPATPSLRRLPRVQHLETPLAGTLRAPGGLLDLAARLHPTPAVAGASRAAALGWLRRHEALRRGWYAGAVGWLDAQGGGALAVAIRSALLQGARAFTFAGAGVVRGSDPDAEWDETTLKLETLGRALAARGVV
ncbi:MAG: isochorismate synthase [Planctomycetes bacterium]|nr:isochorismate synthase [Planctomycetota bacterium]